MIGRFIYIAMCLTAAGYLTVANARGLSFWLGVTRGLSSRGGTAGGHSAFHHK